MSTRTLPSGWSVVKLRDVAEIVRGVSYDKQAVADSPVENYIPLLRATNIKNDRLVLEEDLVFVPKRYVDDEQVLQKWDVVVCMSSGSKHLVGKTGQLTANWKGTFGTFCAVVRFRDNVNPRFAGRYFESQEYRHFISQQSSGVNINNLRARDLADLDFPLPPLRQQQEIVDAIETQFTRLDAAEAALKRVQANLRRYRAAVLKAACEGRLVPTEAELAQAEGRTYEPAAALLERILAERRAQWQAEHPGKKYKEPAGPDVSALPELPEGWCWATVEQLSSNRKNSLAIGPFGSSLKVADYRESGVPLVFVRNIRAAKFSGLDDHFVSQEKANELKAHTVTGGDILITKMGEPPGDACMYPLTATPGAIITADCIKLALCDDCGGHTQLFVHFLNATQVRDQVNHITQGVAQKKVSLERYRTIALPLPPLLEQDRIANAIETLLSASGALVDDVAANLKRAERLRQAILVSAFSGRLASDQDHAMKQADFSF